MKIVVIGGTGLIGSNIVNRLRHHGHETVAASPRTGVNTITGQGLAEALAGGSDRFPLDELARKFLAARKDKREVIADVHARYFGSELDDRSLVTGDNALIGSTRFLNWLSHS